ncbi:hypothetical protein HPB48_017527 [Haemaphysalis longicornis]|uniref:Uncharacterized protein n=1 Tax=Haemaphysalis longicornis TaxID=44386 RepID=A0A9J6G0G8_HAELO|nr:hypothetical protein HPB48_017527 [Haemaphysalis longicornis]
MKWCRVRLFCTQLHMPSTVESSRKASSRLNFFQALVLAKTMDDCGPSFSCGFETQSKAFKRRGCSEIGKDKSGAIFINVGVEVLYVEVKGRDLITVG